MAEQLLELTIGETGQGVYQNRASTGAHHLIADEPADVGGNDTGPNPYQFLLAALGACTSMTVRMYADRKGWPLARVSVDLSHVKLEETDPHTGAARDRFTRTVHLEGDLDDTQRARLLEIADKCPVHRTLHGDPLIETDLAS